MSDGILLAICMLIGMASAEVAERLDNAYQRAGGLGRPILWLFSVVLVAWILIEFFL